MITNGNEGKIGQKKEHPKVGKWGFISTILASVSFLLNHSMRASGFNLSLADVLLVVLLFSLIVTSNFYILRYSFLFFSVLAGVTLSTTLFFTPVALGIHLDSRSVVGDFIKIVVSFLYFIVGSSIARSGLQKIALKWFAIGAAAVASVGVAMEISGIRFLEDIFYYGSVRFRGFMSDPNFYSILSCAGFAYFSYSSHFSPVIRRLIMVILAVSVVLSGSKTGLVALIVVCTVILVTRAIHSKNQGKAIILPFIALFILLFINPIRQTLSRFAYRLSEDIPQLSRTAVLLSDDPLQAISGDGSSRDDMWSVGLQIVETSPIFGVGIGTYNDVADSIFGQRGLAHNTYIQLAAEWGLVLSLILFVWIASLILRASVSVGDSIMSRDLLILRETIIVFMIGSISLSLNNARMLWFFLGILAYILYERSKIRRLHKKNGYLREPQGDAGRG